MLVQPKHKYIFTSQEWELVRTKNINRKYLQPPCIFTLFFVSLFEGEFTKAVEAYTKCLEELSGNTNHEHRIGILYNRTTCYLKLVRLRDDHLDTNSKRHSSVPPFLNLFPCYFFPQSLNLIFLATPLLCLFLL